MIRVPCPRELFSLLFSPSLEVPVLLLSRTPPYDTLQDMWKIRNIRWISGFLFGLFHVLVVVYPLVWAFVETKLPHDGAYRTGEYAGYAMLFFDFPLFLLINVVGNVVGKEWVFGSQLRYTIFFSFFGTLMYVIVGMMLGLIVEKIWSTVRRLRGVT